MATSGEFRFLTLGVLLVVVWLATAQCGKSSPEENGSSPAFLETIPRFPRLPIPPLPRNLGRILRQGYVYLIEEDNPGAETINFRIGQTINPKARLGNWQGNPQRLTVNSMHVRDRAACERQLKTALSGYRSTHGGGTESYTTSRDHAEDLRGLFTQTIQEHCH